MQIYKQMYDEITNFLVTTITRTDAFLMAEKHYNVIFVTL